VDLSENVMNYKDYGIIYLKIAIKDSRRFVRGEMTTKEELYQRRFVSKLIENRWTEYLRNNDYSKETALVIDLLKWIIHKK
jgi:hypothetical protein